MNSKGLYREASCLVLTIVALFASMSTIANPSEGSPETYVTRRGVVFTRDTQGSLKNSWKTPDGISWGSCLGAFTNIGQLSPLPAGSLPPSFADSELITGSDAVRACESVGARLPTLDDYQVLSQYFFPGVELARDEQFDRSDFLALFPDCTDQGVPNRAWTSSDEGLGPKYIDGWDFFGDPRDPTAKLAVRCVTYPEIPKITPALVTYRTSLGGQFTQVLGENFLKGWADPSGAIWIMNAGLYSNSFENSAAKQACTDLGAKLPSNADFAKLLSYFEVFPSGASASVESPDFVRLTTNGLRDFFSIFYGSQNLYFWSSTLGDEGPEIFGSMMRFSLYLNGASYMESGADDRTSQHSVMCVLER